MKKFILATFLVLSSTKVLPVNYNDRYWHAMNYSEQPSKKNVISGVCYGLGASAFQGIFWHFYINFIDALVNKKLTLESAASYGLVLPLLLGATASLLTKSFETTDKLRSHNHEIEAKFVDAATVSAWFTTIALGAYLSLSSVVE